MDFERLADLWNGQADAEERWSQRPSINRALRWREVQRHTTETRTILDIGGGTGAFSVPLARQGFDVTHLDIAVAMLDVARRKDPGTGTLRFVHANVGAWEEVGRTRFDLVLNMDGPVSAAGDAAEDVIRATCALAARTVIFTACHKAFALPQQRDGNAAIGRLRAFTPRELAALVAAEGFTILRAGGIGSLVTLSNSIAAEGKACSGELSNTLLDECESFDRDVLADGPGSPDDTGLIVVARRLP